MQESLGRSAPVRTYEDMLTNPHDEDLFEYYATAQLRCWIRERGKCATVGKPAIFRGRPALA